MEEPDREIVQRKVERAAESGPSYEYLVDGHAIGEQGMVPCLLEGIADGNATLKIADGHRTGETVTVPDRYVVGFGVDAVEDACKRLFR